MKDPFGGILLQIAFRLLVPFSLVYVVYVLVLGETSPGGGFQAGVVLAFGIVLARLILGEDTKAFNIDLKRSLAFAGIELFRSATPPWYQPISSCRKSRHLSYAWRY